MSRPWIEPMTSRSPERTLCLLSYQALPCVSKNGPWKKESLVQIYLSIGVSIQVLIVFVQDVWESRLIQYITLKCKRHVNRAMRKCVLCHMRTTKAQIFSCQGSCYIECSTSKKKKKKKKKKQTKKTTKNNNNNNKKTHEFFSSDFTLIW